MKLVFLFFLIQFCFSQSIICNTTSCNPKGGFCIDNTTCTCYRNSTFGFWNNQGCFECFNGFNIGNDCKSCKTNYQGNLCDQCIGNFNITKDCLVCNQGYYGQSCSSSKNF